MKKIGTLPFALALTARLCASGIRMVGLVFMLGLPMIATVFLMVVTFGSLLTQTYPQLAQQLGFSPYHEAQVLSMTTEENSPNEDIQNWLNLLGQQPTHRDILWNIAQIYQTQGKTEEASTYLKAATEVDPNNPLFTQTTSVSIRE